MDLSSTKSDLFLHTQPWLSPITRLLLAYPATPWSALHMTQSPGIVTPFLCTTAMAVSSAIVCSLSACPSFNHSYCPTSACTHYSWLYNFPSLTFACTPHLWLSPATIWPCQDSHYSKTNDHTQCMVLLPTVKTLLYITLMSQSPTIVNLFLLTMTY